MAILLGLQGMYIHSLSLMDWIASLPLLLLFTVLDVCIQAV